MLSTLRSQSCISYHLVPTILQVGTVIISMYVKTEAEREEFNYPKSQLQRNRSGNEIKTASHYVYITQRWQHLRKARDSTLASVPEYGLFGLM